jgi:hypothetical protein
MAVLTKSLKQPDAGAQPPAYPAWSPSASGSKGLQDTMTFLTENLDFPNPIQLDLFSLRDFLSQCLKVAFNRFTDKFLRQCPFLTGNECYSIGVFHRLCSCSCLELSVKLTTDN